MGLDNLFLSKLKTIELYKIFISLEFCVIVVKIDKVVVINVTKL